MSACFSESCSGTVHRHFGPNHEGRWCPVAIEKAGGEAQLVEQVWRTMTSPQKLGVLAGDGGTVWSRLHNDGYVALSHDFRSRPTLTACGAAVQSFGKAQPAPKPPKKAAPCNEDAVAKAWKEGRRLAGSSLSTDGSTVYSFRLPIGITRGKKKIAYDYRGRISGSTSRHCGVVIRVADKTIALPKEKR